MTYKRGIMILTLTIAVLAGLNYFVRLAGPDDYRSMGVIEYYLVGRENPLPIATFPLYAIFSAFLFCQTVHLKEFSGASRLFELSLTIVGTSSFIAGLIFLILAAIRFSWFDFISFILLHNAVRLFLIPLHHTRTETSHLIIVLGSILGFVVVPTSLILMYMAIFQ